MEFTLSKQQQHAMDVLVYSCALQEMTDMQCSGLSDQERTLIAEVVLPFESFVKAIPEEHMEVLDGVLIEHIKTRLFQAIDAANAA